jgi:hypothetical protein
MYHAYFNGSSTNQKPTFFIKPGIIIVIRSNNLEVFVSEYTNEINRSRLSRFVGA